MADSADGTVFGPLPCRRGDLAMTLQRDAVQRGRQLEPIDHDVVDVHGPRPVAGRCKDDANSVYLDGAQEAEIQLEPCVGWDIAEIRYDMISCGAGRAPRI